MINEALIRQAAKDGWQAREQKVGVAANPHHPLHPLHAAWFEGWFARATCWPKDDELSKHLMQTRGD